MKATETTIKEFLSKTDVQFVIPIYQRNYDWVEAQCSQLLNDIITTGSNENIKSHFIGSIVYIHNGIYSVSGINEMVVIDGQQRLTTITILFLALQNFAKEIGDIRLANKINDEYLTNKYADDDMKLKLRPADSNSSALKFLFLEQNPNDFKEKSNTIDNYIYFKSKINKDNYDIIRDGLNKLVFVDIALDRNYDDPQRIFESLNSTGMDLSQADLIRNFLLMDLESKHQEEIYKKYWSVIEENIKDADNKTNKISDFIRDFITLKTSNIPNKEKVYYEFKRIYNDIDYETLKIELEKIKSLSYFYSKLINPSEEKDKDIRLHLNYIKRIEINVSYPFLMKIFEDYEKNVISKQTFIQVLELVQSYAWRRNIVNLPTNALNKVFMSLYGKVDKDRYLESIEEFLVSKVGTSRFPNDNEIKENLRFKDVYNTKSRLRTYFLERLENFNNNEYVEIDGNNKITIEHIFPQKPEEQWKADLDEDDYLDLQDKYLHTIANLTLTGNNGALSNSRFSVKRDLKDKGYKDSRLWLNSFLSKIEIWNLDNLEKRYDLIYKRFLDIWKYPEALGSNVIKFDLVNIFDAESPKFKMLDYVSFDGIRYDIKKISDLYIEILKKLYSINSDIFHNTDLGKKLKLSDVLNKSNLIRAVEIGNNSFVEVTLDSISKFDRIKYALEKFNMKDKLFIKYASTSLTNSESE